MATCTLCSVIVIVLCRAVYIGGSSANTNQDFFSIDITNVDGTTASLEKYRGKVVLVVNVASECGFTDGHYRGMVKLQKNLGHTNRFQVLAFPCNQFGAQEPKAIGEILKFAESSYSVNFPIFNKINTVDKHVAEVYSYLTEQTGVVPNWNFWKYLVNHKGEVIGQWGPWSSVEEVFPIIKQAVDDVLVEEEKALEERKMEQEAATTQKPQQERDAAPEKVHPTQPPPAPVDVHEDL